MLPRFFTSELDLSAGRAVLDADETAHLTRVLRLGRGALVDVFDGRGGAMRAEIEEVGKSRVGLRLLGPVVVAAEPAIQVTLVAAVLKGDKMDHVVRDATMMGVTRIQPLLTARTEVSAAALARGRRRDRWWRVAVSSAKQCGRGVVPVIADPVGLDDWSPDGGDGPTLVLVEPAAGGGPRLSEVPRAGRATVIAGPEGGWAPDELDALAQAGARPVSLGPRTLRADAVPVAGLAALFEAWAGW